jgi:16S rRNA pseudouridine516 synthase
VDKVYLAQVDGAVDGGDIEALAAGLTLADGTRCLPAGLEPLGDGSSCLVTLREGKYHQVKRMLAARGKPVRGLHRLSMGPLALDRGLKPGKWRFLTLQERTELQRLDAAT